MKKILNTLLLGGFLLLAQNAFTQSEVTSYFCPPCNMDCDLIEHAKPGTCGHCGMTLIKRTKSEQMALLKETKKDQISVAVFIHNGMEILDFAGPVEVFTASGFEVVTVGLTKEPILSQGTVTITPRYSLEDCPKTDIVAVFGGNATKVAQNTDLQKWLKERAKEAKLMYSVCTGAFMFAEAGLLDGLEATTFHSAIDNLQKTAPKAKVVKGVKYVDSGKIVTAAGVSSGIDGALYVVEKMKGKETAQATADYMEWENYPLEKGKINKP